MSLAKIELEAAVQAALAQDGSAIGDTALKGAFEDFLDRRFAGGAAALRRVHDIRQELFERTDLMNDYSDSQPGQFDGGHTISRLADISAPPNSGRLLYHLARTLQPERTIELGTNIGISTAYLATGLMLNGHGQIATLEASEIRSDLARSVFNDLDLNNVVMVPGYFEDTLVPALGDHGPVDLAFIDGHHQEEPTFSYFETICEHSSPGAVLLFDDIRWSDGMFRAWNRIAEDVRVRLAVDLSRLGLAILK